MQKLIRSRAPLRISFAGGGTDVEPYPQLRGGAVISTTIDRYAYVSLDKNQEKKIILKSQDFGLLEKFSNISEVSSKKGKLDLLKATIRSLGVKNKFFTASVQVDAPPGSGLGSSSAVTVSMIGAVLSMISKQLTNYEIAERAYKIERIDLGIQGGRQDQYSSVFGGFNLIEFHKSKVNVTPLRVKKEILNELLASIILCDTRKTRLSAKILERQIKNYKKQGKKIMDSLDKLKNEAYELKEKLIDGNTKDIGEILHEGWENKKQLDTFISNKAIDKIYDKTRKMGVIGGKLLGAGGGGHFMFLCEPEKKAEIIKEVTKSGYKLIKFNFDKEGLQSWTVKNGVVQT